MLAADRSPTAPGRGPRATPPSKHSLVITPAPAMRGPAGLTPRNRGHGGCLCSQLKTLAMPFLRQADGTLLQGKGPRLLNLRLNPSLRRAPRGAGAAPPQPGSPHHPGQLGSSILAELLQLLLPLSFKTFRSGREFGELLTAAVLFLSLPRTGPIGEPRARAQCWRRNWARLPLRGRCRDISKGLNVLDAHSSTRTAEAARKTATKTVG